MVSESQLKSIAKDIRRMTLLCAGSSGEGHLGGALSISDLLAVLYNKMRVDPQNPKKPGRDRLIVSKGHAGPAVYAALASRDFFPKDWLKTLNALGTNLPSHCDMNKTPGIDMTTGSLGQGLSAAVGCAIASRLSADGALIYCILGDGESQEGQIWEAFMSAAHYKLDNLTVIIDNKSTAKYAISVRWGILRLSGKPLVGTQPLSTAMMSRPFPKPLTTLKPSGVNHP